MKAAASHSDGLLSVAQLMAHRQCPKRLWLSLHRPQYWEGDARAVTGEGIREVQALSRYLVEQDPSRPPADGTPPVWLTRLVRALTRRRPLFGVSFIADGVTVEVDIMVPIKKGGQRAWRLLLVTGSTRVKPIHRAKAALIAAVVRKNGFPVAEVAFACIDSAWEYRGHGDYHGWLREVDAGESSQERAGDLERWIADAHTVARRDKAPCRCTGPHCKNPTLCGFLKHCQSEAACATYPVAWLPNVQTQALKRMIEDGVRDMRNVPDALLNAQQRRVKACTLAGSPDFDEDGAHAALGDPVFPAYFLDLETIQFAIPVWGGTRPFQHIPYQFDLWCTKGEGEFSHVPYLDVSGADPSRGLAEALIAACGQTGPIFVFNAEFEASRIAELAQRFPDLAPACLALRDRLVDLLPIVEAHYYHPSQHGSWSLKRLIPVIAPDLEGELGENVHDGLSAMAAYREAIASGTLLERKKALVADLLDYGEFDTYALIRLWLFLGGRNWLTAVPDTPPCREETVIG